MSERANVLVTRPIIEEPLTRLRARCNVTIHENDFGIPRNELLRVVRGPDAIAHDAHRKGGCRVLRGGQPPS